MNLSLTAFFNLRLAHMQQLGYARCVQFSTLAGAPLPISGASVPAIKEEERSGRPLKRRFVSGAGIQRRADGGWIGIGNCGW